MCRKNKYVQSKQQNQFTQDIQILPWKHMKRAVYRNDQIYKWEKFVRQDFDISHCLMGNLKQMLRI